MSRQFVSSHRPALDGLHPALHWTGGQRAWQAVIEILLPIAAVAFGITAFGLVYYLTSSNAV